MISAANVMGIIGLPAPVKELASQKWDVIIVGAGHNGLTCAAYLARAGKKVLVLEARERIGGACTLEEPFPGFRLSPCAYVAGLLHPLVMRELDFQQHGFDWTPVLGGQFVPFEDDSSVLLWEDEGRCEAEIKRFAPKDVNGWRAMSDVIRRASDAIRPDNECDMWIGRAPTREQMEERLKGDEEAVKMLFEWSMFEMTSRYLSDERLISAYLGQGIIGTNASPYEPGTASIWFHHSSGRMDPNLPSVWGYVKGGMGMVSFILCDVAREAGATVAAGVPIMRILPGEGVELDDGGKIYAPIVVSNADPRATLRLLSDAADASWKAQVLRVPIKGCTVKVNAALNELPNFRARPGTTGDHFLAMINTTLSLDEWRTYCDTAKGGELPSRVWTEIYIQTAYDPSVAPAGKHTMSVFAQYVPNEFREGDWNSNRELVGKTVIDSIGRYVSNFPSAVMDMDVLGPPDIEQRVGLTGGHIFQGEILPQYMWSNRLSPKTPMKGVYLCGAGTHPGGSVIAMNGRNAAMQILADLNE